jgi:hypothetical protein
MFFMAHTLNLMIVNINTKVTNVSVHLKNHLCIKMLSVWHPDILLTLHKWTLPRVTVEMHLVSNWKAVSSFWFVCWLFHPVFHMLPQEITVFVDILHHCSIKDHRLAIRRAFCLKTKYEFWSMLFLSKLGCNLYSLHCCLCAGQGQVKPSHCNTK